MKKRAYFLPFALCLLPFVSKTQTSELAVGSWRIFQPYQNGNDVTQSDNYVYWSTGLSILRYNKQDQTTEKWDKLNHLTQAGISRIAFDKTNNTLIVIYDDNVIDLVNATGARTLSDIKNNIAIVGDKNIYDIYSTPTITYLAAGFGVVGLDVARGEFQFTTFTNQKINSITVLQNAIYAASSSGIFTIGINAATNIADFSNWKKLGNSDGFAIIYSAAIVRNFNNLLYFNYNDSLCYLSASKKIISLQIDKSLKLNYLTTEGKNLIAGFIQDCSPFFFGACTVGFKIDATNAVKNLPNNCYSANTRAIEDAANNVWFASQYPTDFRYLNNNANNCNAVQINSPVLSSAGSIALTDSSAWIVSQGVAGLVARFEGEGFSLYQPSQKNQWTNYTPATQPALQNTQSGIDNYEVSINKVTNKVYVSSFNHGLIELQNGIITKVYDSSNSPIQPAVGDVGRQRVTGLFADDQGNEWVINANTPNALLVLKPNNTWLKMQTLSPQNVLTHIVSDSSNYKWIINASNGSGGIWIYDTTQYSINNVSNHRTRYIDNSALPTEVQNGILNTICTDLEGRVWVGTDKGVCVFDCGSDPIASTTCTARLIISTLGGISEYLLLNKAVNVIAVDGGNRKWFGTTTGLIVTTADGKTQIYNFNTDNSPLVSNNITSLAIRNKTGEVFIGTDKGVMVYRANATTGGTFNAVDSAYAFPNPVQPDYDGPIAIKNLSRDAAVKITDVNGNLIYETRANGGEAIWNGRDFNSRRVQSGVYLAWVANVRNIDAGDGVVVKILVIR